MIYDFCQSDARWASHSYAGETLAIAGCGPTAISDITGHLPPTVADYITSIGGASQGQGTNWNAIAPAATHFGISTQQMNSSSLYGVKGSNVEKNWLAAMKTGKYYGILLMGPGYFCKSGHFIAIKEVKDDNSAYALDVATSTRSGWHTWKTYYQGAVKVFYLSDNTDNIISDTDYTFATATVSYGNDNMDVRMLQLILKAKGLYTLGVDGSFGTGTRTAVKAYQTQAGGLNVDGVCGPLTWASILSLGNSGGKWIAHAVQNGSKGKSVLLAQEGLKALGYYTGDLDEIAGSATETAIRNLQIAKGLSADGVCGKKTFRAIYGK